jgi:ABC-2 type transport system permease protein
MNPAPPASTFPSAAPAAHGVAPHLGHAFGGIWRISLGRVWSRRQAFTHLWTATALAALAYVNTRDGSDDSFHGWTIRFYLTTLMPILAFLSGAGAIREDMKPGGVDYLLTRPVPRPFFVVARFASHLVCVQATCLLAFAGLMAVGVHRGIGDLASVGPTLWFAQAVTITAFMAMGFFFGSFTARYLVLAINYAAIIEIGLGQIPIALNKLSVLRHVKAYLLPLTPDPSTAFEPQGAVVTAGFILLFTVVWVGAAALLFSLQEFAGQRPKEA